MTKISNKEPDAISLQQRLSEWDNEGGAGRCGPKESTAMFASAAIPNLINTELVQLRVRVIALENLVTALLSGAPTHQHDLIRAMAAQIAPRAGMTVFRPC